MRLSPGLQSEHMMWPGSPQQRVWRMKAGQDDSFSALHRGHRRTLTLDLRMR